MANGKSTWKYNKLLTARRNYFWNGGSFRDVLNEELANSQGYSLGPEYAELKKNQIAAHSGVVTPKKKPQINPALSATVGAVGAAAGNLMSQGMTSTAGNILQGAAGIASAIPGGQLVGAGLNLASGAANLLWGAKFNDANIAQVENNINNLNNFQSNAGDYDTLTANWANADAGMNFTNSFIGKDGIFSNKVSKKANSLREGVAQGVNHVQDTLSNNADNIMNTQMQNLQANYAAKGGQLNKFGDFTNGLIYINNGGSHEENPHEGVPMGVDQEGVPNLVEEGETIFNDYVYSKRLTVPKAVRNKYKLGGKKPISFADASKKLAKESEERPNDPISKNGLGAFMSDLANAQEELKARQQQEQMFAQMQAQQMNPMMAQMGEIPMGEEAMGMEQMGGVPQMNANYSALGGNLFDKGGNKNKTKSTSAPKLNVPGLYFGMNPIAFNPYDKDGNIDWNILNGENSPFVAWRNAVAKNKSFDNKEWKERLAEGYNKYNKGKPGYKPVTADDITEDIFYNGLRSKDDGSMYYALNYAGDPSKTYTTKHVARNSDGTFTDIPEEDYYYSGTKKGYSYNNNPNRNYNIANNGNYEEEIDDDGNVTRTYYYDPIKKNKDKKHYVKLQNEDGSYGDAMLFDDAKSQGLLKGYISGQTGKLDDNDVTYYDIEEKAKQGKYADWLRYAPAVAYGIGAITDAIGLTNKPDYSNADALLEASSKNNGTYQPVRFNPISSNLAYSPFDIDYALNKMSAEAGATRRNIMNTAGGNRGTAIAATLAADNNLLNQTGNLYRQAFESNLAQRQQYANYLQGIESFNSNGFLQADTANQKALMDNREFTLKGTMAGAEMRERARLAAEQNKANNISGFFQSLGDIGFEEKNSRMRDWTIKKGLWGNGTYDYGRFSTQTPQSQQQNQAVVAKKGGKLGKKKKKGLTF